MGNKFKDIVIKNCTYYFFDGMINIKNLDLIKIKIDQKSFKNVITYHIRYAPVKNLSYVKINNVDFLYLIINKVNG